MPVPSIQSFIPLFFLLALAALVILLPPNAFDSLHRLSCTDISNVASYDNGQLKLTVENKSCQATLIPAPDYVYITSCGFPQQYACKLKPIYQLSDNSCGNEYTILKKMNGPKGLFLDSSNRLFVCAVDYADSKFGGIISRFIPFPAYQPN